MSNLMFDSDTKNLGIQVEECLNESGQKEKKYKIKGIFTTIGEKNRNGRVYPRDLWVREVQNYQNEIKNGTINTLMEYEHPSRTEVDPMQAVAKIEKLQIEGNYVMGEAVLLNNEKSNQLKSLIENGVKISVSSRGVGNVENGTVTSFKLITYDVVPNPSDYNATMNGICESHQLTEGVIKDVEYDINEFGNIVERKELSIQEKQNIIKNTIFNFLDKL